MYDDHMTGEKKRKGKERKGNAASEWTADLEPIRLEGLDLSFRSSKG